VTDYDARKYLSESSKPVQRTMIDNVPVYNFGYASFYAESPKLVDDDKIQSGNTNEPVKVHPKKSWDIKSNLIGATPPRMPRTPANDYQPLECINLIDGNDETCWSSTHHTLSDEAPAWIRIDLAKERIINKIILKKRPVLYDRNAKPGSMYLFRNAYEAGRAMPGRITIKTSQDAYSWTTLFDGESGDAPDRDIIEFPFDPIRVKQVWIIGDRLTRCESWLYAFSIASVEIYDEKGRNVALASYGNGVTASSVFHGLGNERESHQWFWPLHFDLGLKWTRIGYHDDMINWHWVEKVKGVLAFDEEAEQAIDLLVKNGVNIVYVLGFGNRLYQEDPKRHLPQLWEWYFENPEPPKTAEAIEAWAHFIRFSVLYFKDRIRYFEVWNEWNGENYWGDTPDTEHYIKLARIAIQIIRECAPDARVMMGSSAGFCHGIASWSKEDLAIKEKTDPQLAAVAALAREVDVIGYHPFYQPDIKAGYFREYAGNVRAFKAFCESKGFRGGEYMASEFNVGANYPPTEGDLWWGAFNYTEIQKAKIVSQLHVMHTALGVGSFFCELWSGTYPHDLSLMRRTFASYPISPLNPQAAYYVTRNLSTALEDLVPAEFNYFVSGDTQDLEAWPLEKTGERTLAAWFAGSVADDCEGRPIDFIFEFESISGEAFNPLTGELFMLNIESGNGRTTAGGILVRDYPVLLRFKIRS
jgi:hypothetical protein